MMPFAYFHTFNLTINLPFILPKFALDFLTNKYSLFFSNLNASKVRFKFNGKKQLGSWYFIPNFSKMNFGISVVTCGDICSLAVFAD